MESAGLGSGDTEDRSALPEFPVSLGGQVTQLHRASGLSSIMAIQRVFPSREFLSEVRKDF